MMRRNNDTFKSGAKTQLIIMDFHTGKQLSVQDISNQQSLQRVEIKQLKNYKVLQVIITEKGRPVLSSKVLVE